MKLRFSLDKAANIAVIVAAVTFVTVALKGYFPWRSTAQDAAAPGAGSPIEPVTDLVVKNAGQAVVKSSKSPKVAVVEFSDFQCPYCSRYATETYPQIQREFVDTGRVEYVFFNLPLEQLHPLALRASEAAECAGEQQGFWSMRERLFQNPKALSEEGLLAHAQDIGLRLPDFRTCLAGAMLPRIRTQMAEAARAGVSSTPTFLIGRIESPGTVRVLYRLRGAQPYPVFVRALEDALTEKVALQQ
jgi:protein-disulfide isomerase